MTAVCTEEDVLEALIVLRHCVPGEHPEISEMTASVWHAALALYPGDVVRSVALHWNGDRYPSREEFRDAVSAEQRNRREADAQRALASPEEHPGCPECDGHGWKVLSTSPLWITELCPRGCVPPLPMYAQGRREERRRRKTHTAPARAEYGREVTDRMTGDRGEW